jgi:hypothetical protein
MCGGLSFVSWVAAKKFRDPATYSSSRKKKKKEKNSNKTRI